MKCVVNSFEMLLYYCIWVSMVIWGLYQFLEAQNEIFSKHSNLRLSLRHLSAGWTFLDREKDISDFEWISWKYLVKLLWIYIIFQFLVSEILRQFNTIIIKYWYIVSTMFFISYFMGFLQLIMILTQPIIFFIIILCDGKRISTWVISLILFCCASKFHDTVWQLTIENRQDFQKEQVYIFLIGRAWVELRCISYCLDFIERQAVESREVKREHMWSIFINLFSYVLYLPVLYFGPIILYEDFEQSFQTRSEKLWIRLKRFAVDMVLYLIYSFLLEFAFHLFYFNAMHSDVELVKKLPTIALAGGGLWMALAFYVKCVILYGTASAFARLDNIVAPPIPRCLARTHLCSSLWKYFDVGFYQFLLRYIYKPCFNILCKYTKLQNIVNKLLAAFPTFAFILLWHGIYPHIFIWTVLNYIGISLENAARAFSTTAWYTHFKVKVLKTDAVEGRFIAGLASVLLMWSAISSYYFLARTEENIYVGLLKWPEPRNIMLLFVAAYCCCQVSMSLLSNDVSSRTDNRSTRVKVD